MKALFWGIAIFYFSLTVHFVIWRARLPRKQTRTLFFIFFFTFFLILGLLNLSAVLNSEFKNILPKNAYENSHLCVFYILLSLAYIVSYTALEADSPSLFIILLINSSKESGITAQELRTALTDDLLIKPRIVELLGAGLIVPKAEKYRISWKGRLLLVPFVLYRKLSGLPKGG